MRPSSGFSRKISRVPEEGYVFCFHRLLVDRESLVSTNGDKFHLLIDGEEKVKCFVEDSVWTLIVFPDLIIFVYWPIYYSWTIIIHIFNFYLYIHVNAQNVYIVLIFLNNWKPKWVNSEKRLNQEGFKH